MLQKTILTIIAGTFLITNTLYGAPGPRYFSLRIPMKYSETGSSPESKEEFPTKESVEAALAVRDKLGLPNNARALYRGPFRNWALWKAAKDHGVDLPQRPNPSPYTTKKAVTTEFTRRKKENIPSHYKALLEGEHKDTALLYAAQQHGVPFPKKQKTYTTKKSIRDDFRKRREQGLTNDATALTRGPNQNRVLYLAAKEHGVPIPKKKGDKRKGKGRFPTKRSTIRGLKVRDDQDLSNTSKALSEGPDRDHTLLRAARRFGIDRPREERTNL